MAYRPLISYTTQYYLAHPLLPTGNIFEGKQAILHNCNLLTQAILLCPFAPSHIFTIIFYVISGLCLRYFHRFKNIHYILFYHR